MLKKAKEKYKKGLSHWFFFLGVKQLPKIKNNKLVLEKRKLKKKIL